MDTIACAFLFGVIGQRMFIPSLYTVGLPTSWPGSQPLLISLERRGMLCLKDDSLNNWIPLLGILALNLAADCPLLTQHLSWKVLVRSLVWKVTKHRLWAELLFRPGRRLNCTLKSWAVQEEVHTNPYGIVWYSKTDFFFPTQLDWWQFKWKTWIPAFAEQPHMYVLSLATVSVCTDILTCSGD